MQRLLKGCVAGLVVSVLSQAVLGAPAPAAPAAAPAAATSPTTKPLGTPPGFEKVTVGNHTVLCEPNDVAWVKTALGNVKEPEKPKDDKNPTLASPAEMLKNLPEKRPNLVKQMTSDLGLDEKAVNAYIDEKIVPEIKKFENVKVPVQYLVTSPEKLKKVVKAGWGEPRFRLNIVANAVAFDNALSFSIDKPMEEQILVAFYDDKDDNVAQRTTGLTNFIQGQDAQIQFRLSLAATGSVFGEYSKWIEKTIFEPLKLQADQKWFQNGVTSFTSAKYAALTTGVDRRAFLSELINEDQLSASLFSRSAVNLYKPDDPSKMNPVMKEIYEAQGKRKATLVVASMVETQGDSSIPDALKAIVKEKPATGEAMVQTISKATTLKAETLTKQLQPW